MIMLSINEFLRNWKRILTISLLISIMAVIVTAVNGSFSYEKNLMASFEQFDGKKGYYVYGGVSGLNIDESRYDIYSFSSGLIYDGGYEIPVYAQPAWCDFSPRISEGSYQIGKTKDGMYPVLVGGNYSERYPVGSIIDAGNDTKFIVTGVIVKNSSIMGADTLYQFDKIDYRMFYNSSSANVFLLGDERLLAHSGIGLVPDGQNSIVVAKRNVSDKELLKEFQRIQQLTMGTCLRLTDFISASENVYMQKIMTYIPLVIVGLVAVIICCYASTYVSFLYSLKHYSIFYLVGGKEWQRLLICLGNGLGIILASIAETAAVFWYIHYAEIGSDYMFQIDGTVIRLLGIFYLAFLVMMSLITWISMSGMSPKEQLIRTAE
ncbi:MAG: hypothetical protein ACI4D8_01930 [Wujia sp.]